MPCRLPENRLAARKREVNPQKNKLWDSNPESHSCFAWPILGAGDAPDVVLSPCDRLHGQCGVLVLPSLGGSCRSATRRALRKRMAGKARAGANKAAADRAQQAL